MFERGLSHSGLPLTRKFRPQCSPRRKPERRASWGSCQEIGADGFTAECPLGL